MRWINIREGMPSAGDLIVLHEGQRYYVGKVLAPMPPDGAYQIVGATLPEGYLIFTKDSRAEYFVLPQTENPLACKDSSLLAFGAALLPIKDTEEERLRRYLDWKNNAP